MFCGKTESKHNRAILRLALGVVEANTLTFTH